MTGFSATHAALVDLSDTPVSASAGVAPNLTLTMDDSGSMYWSFMPDGIFGYNGTNRAKSSTFNSVYYNPDVSYDPPVNADGSSFPNSSFTSAPVDGFDTSRCSKNLSTSFRPTWYYGNNCDTADSNREYSGGAEPAYYYVYDGVGSVNDDSSYVKVVVSATSSPGGADERTNFANWFTYYRNRNLLAKTAASRAFANLGENARVAHQSINATPTVSTLEEFAGSGRSDFFDWLYDVGANGGTPLVPAMKRAGDKYSTADPYRDDPGDSSSPERACRQNYHILLTDGYWNSGSGVGGNQDNSSFSLPETVLGQTAYGAVDPYKDGNSDYLADNAFYYWVRDLRPGLDNTVPTAINDESTDINNDGVVDDLDKFLNPSNDPATWQHMVNFVVGLGVTGTLDPDNDLAELADPSGSKDWGADKIDDLWHAAVNSRGKYFSAKDPTALVNAFKEAINTTTNRSGSAAPVALNSGAVISGSQVFQVRYNGTEYTGQLIARPLSDGDTTNGNESGCDDEPIGTICAPQWEASCELDGGSFNVLDLSCSPAGTVNAGDNWDIDRSIMTLNSATGSGVPFRWTSLSTTQQAALTANDTATEGEQRLQWIRGDRSQEQQFGGAYRNRDSRLGDIMNSNPVYVGPPIRFYPDALEGASYVDFKETNDTRTDMVYVGANDGMLHAFSADTGEEIFAYIPGAVYSNLAALPANDYEHKNYVDGPLTEGDVYFDSEWHSVIAGGMGLGGQGIFALDITDPDNFDESDANNVILWEFTDADDPDMGYTYGRPAIIRLNNGQWAAAFGNGYNNSELDGNPSATGNAVLFIVSIEDGTVIKKIDTGAGIDDNVDGDNSVVDPPNGLSSIRAVDDNADYTTDYIFAGDLQGNVWKFDLSDPDEKNWGVDRFFVATDSSGTRQPITTAPRVKRHPQEAGYLVLFGTGKFLGRSDVIDSSEQTFYSVWDREGALGQTERKHLLEQEIIGVNAGQFSASEARVTTAKSISWHTDEKDAVPTTSNTHMGWYMDLVESRERVHQPPLLRHGRIIFVTVTPTGNPCLAGGTSWLMELNADTGARLPTSPFDYNNDEVFSDADQVDVSSGALTTGTGFGSGNTDYNGLEEVGGSGIREKTDLGSGRGGVLTAPVVQMQGQGEAKMSSSSTGRIFKIKEDPGLQYQRSWRELR